MWAHFLFECAFAEAVSSGNLRGESDTSSSPFLLGYSTRRKARDDPTGNDITQSNGAEERNGGMGKKTNFFSISSIDYFSFLFFFGHWSLVLLLHSLSLL